MRHPGPLRIRYSTLLLLAVAVFGALFLSTVGIDALEGRNDFQFFADSNTYHAAASGELGHVDDIVTTVGIAGNFLGPLLLLELVGGNYYAVLLANVLLMYLSIRSLTRSLHFDGFKLLLILLLNPMTLSSLLSVNKEIISLVFLALLIGGYRRRSILLLALAVVLSVLVRWQLTLFALVLIGVAGPWNPLRRYRWTTLGLLLIALSIVYVLLVPILEPVQENFDFSAAEYEGSGSYDWLLGLQNAGLYWLIFPLKAAHLLFATGLRVDRLLNPTLIYNDVWQLLHSTATLVLFLVLWRARLLSLRNDLVFISAIYLAVFAMTPIYVPRYFYLVYVLWALALVCRPAPAILGSSQRRRRSEVLPAGGAPDTPIETVQR